MRTKHKLVCNATIGVNRQSSLPKDVLLSVALTKLKRKLSSERVFKTISDRDDNPKKSERKKLKRKRAHFRKLANNYDW